jgi:tetratricopeptide (TPR) repeat protein
MKQNDPEKAVPLLTEAVELKDNIRIAYVDIGSILIERKRYPEALVALQRAQKLDPEQPDVHYRLARLYRQMGNAEASQTEFAKVRELHQKEEESVGAKIVGAPSPRPSPAAE